MAYPFGPPIAYAVFVKRLVDEFGCEIRATKTPYRDTRENYGETFQYLFRATSNGPRVAVLPEAAPTKEMMPTVVRSICARLDVDNTRFGVLSDDDGLDD